MSKTITIGVIAIACLGAQAQACDLDGFGGGRFSPFYAMAHNASQQQSSADADANGRYSFKPRPPAEDVAITSDVQPEQDNASPGQMDAEPYSGTAPPDGDAIGKITF